MEDDRLLVIQIHDKQKKNDGIVGISSVRQLLEIFEPGIVGDA